MTDTYVGRIFWKELRAQRAFWIGVLGLAIGLQLLAAFALPRINNWNANDLSFLAGICRYSIALVLACSFAVGSVAIAFAGEVEGRTKGFLQRFPLRPRDLLAGKLSLSVVGAYLLFAALWLSGGLILMAASMPVVPGATSPNVSMVPRTSDYALGPFLFIAVGSLFSLVLGDVLITVIVAGTTTAFLLAIPVIRDHLAVQGGLIALAVIADHFLARRWLRTGAIGGWTVPFPKIGRRERTVADRTIMQEHARSVVAWRRGMSSLLWKEWRQALPICLTLIAMGLLAVVLSALSHQIDWTLAANTVRILILLVVIPLIPGIAAVRADRKNNAYRSLADRGITPDAYWVSKHLVWLSLTLLMSAVLLAADTLNDKDSLWRMAADAAHTTFHGESSGLLSDAQSLVEPVLMAGFHVLLLYSLGYLLALMMPGPLMAFFSGILVWIGIAIAWTFLASLRVPFWWTIAPLPFVFLAVSWVRTGDWLIGRNTPRAWGKVAATLVIPLVCVFSAIVVYRVIEIPAVRIPSDVLQSVPAGSATAAKKRSLFIDAMEAVSMQPPSPSAQRNADDPQDRWKLVTPEQKAWLKANARARDLALEAVKQPPGAFLLIGSGSQNRGAVLSTLGWRLEQLLLYSAREYEGKDQLDDALACYIAIARLGDDYLRSDQNDGTFPYLILSTAEPDALFSMSRWAAYPKQTTERVKRAIQKFQSFAELDAPMSRQVLRDWRARRRELRDRIWNGSRANEKDRTVAEHWWVRWFAPWQLWRLERYVDFLFAFRLEETQNVESELHTSGFVTVNAERLLRWHDREYALDRYRSTTFEPPYFDAEPNVSVKVSQLAIERMSLVALAIADFQRVHQKRPDSLAELVPLYFNQLPVDPWFGRDFLYFPAGLTPRIRFDNGTLDSGTPFLASVGMADSHFTTRALPGHPNARVTVAVSMLVPAAANAQIPTDSINFRGPHVQLR